MKPSPEDRERILTETHVDLNCPRFERYAELYYRRKKVYNSTPKMTSEEFWNPLLAGSLEKDPAGAECPFQSRVSMSSRCSFCPLRKTDE